MSPSANPSTDPPHPPGPPSEGPGGRAARLARGLRHALGTILARLSALLLALLALLATAETVAWTYLDRSWAAAQEIQALLLIWLALFGAAWGVAERFHIAVGLVADRLGERARRAIDRLALALTLLFGSQLMLHGAGLASKVRNTLPGTGWPAAVQYLPVAVGGALIALLALAHLVAGPAASPEEQAPESKR